MLFNLFMYLPCLIKCCSAFLYKQMHWLWSFYWKISKTDVLFTVHNKLLTLFLWKLCIDHCFIIPHSVIFQTFPVWRAVVFVSVNVNHYVLRHFLQCVVDIFFHVFQFLLIFIMLCWVESQEILLEIMLNRFHHKPFISVITRASETK